MFADDVFVEPDGPIVHQRLFERAVNPVEIPRCATRGSRVFEQFIARDGATTGLRSGFNDDERVAVESSRSAADEFLSPAPGGATSSSDSDDGVATPEWLEGVDRAVDVLLGDLGRRTGRGFASRTAEPLDAVQNLIERDESAASFPFREADIDDLYSESIVPISDSDLVPEAFGPSTEGIDTEFVAELGKVGAEGRRAEDLLAVLG